MYIEREREIMLRPISEISSCFFGPRPWHIEIRHRVKKTSTINLFGFETLELKIRRFKLLKPTVSPWLYFSPRLLFSKRWRVHPVSSNNENNDDNNNSSSSSSNRERERLCYARGARRGAPEGAA